MQVSLAPTHVSWSVSKSASPSVSRISNLWFSFRLPPSPRRSPPSLRRSPPSPWRLPPSPRRSPPSPRRSALSPKRSPASPWSSPPSPRRSPPSPRGGPKSTLGYEGLGLLICAQSPLDFGHMCDPGPIIFCSRSATRSVLVLR